MSDIPGTRQITPNISANQKLNLTYPQYVNTISDGLPTLSLKPFPDAPTGEQGAPITVTPTLENAITSAIEQAKENQTIIVQSGIYEEALNISKSINLVANGKVIICSAGGETTVSITGGNVTFDGFSIKQKKSRARGALLLNGGTLKLVNCKLSALSNATIMAKNDTLLSIKQCVIKGRNGSALSASHSCQIESEFTTYSYCRIATVSLRSTSCAKFKQCIFLNNPQSGISAIDESQLYVDSCNFVECTAEIRSNGACNVIKGTLFSKTGGSSGIVISQNATAYLYGNIIRGCCVDLRGSCNVTLRQNNYEGGSFLASNSTTANSLEETFTGDTPAAIGVHDTSHLTIEGAKITNLTGIGLVCYEMSKVNAKRLTFDNIALQGIICHSGGDLELLNANIQNVKEDAIMIQDCTLSLQDSFVRNCKKNGISANDVNNCHVSGCKFENNNQCAIIASRSTLDIENVNISNSGYSAIHSIGSTIKLNKVIVGQNKKGGVVSTQNSKVVAENCTFTANNWAALLCEENSKIKAIKSTLSNNQLASNCAGKVTLVNCEVSSHRDTAVQASGKLKVKETTFSNNGSGLIAGASATVKITGSTFQSNRLCIEVTNNANLECSNSKFVGSTGESAVNVTGGGFASYKECQFSQSRNVAVYVDGQIELENSTIEKTGKIALLCTENSKGSVRNNKLIGDGQCGVQIGGGTAVIQSNEIQNFSQFGVYIKPNSRASVENNDYSNNKLANIWKE
ncbi:hypothetical protein TRFO_26244 [Tritrichomonas foetus]|uniref:Right handed beta helix domain-containing protein n=1 Tax=Tritrichomonas foetus TaxID=1144522 RepID=A0A1J4K8X3_9EUKA|nr:hypothetical protein TRFO_26244 [Tritrichomonas foetus]|eukprot:OHT05885.1 hypothetical protein TRFO_26244 [Tritrichomonas foetus]